jgi:hypothetical protein
VDQISSKLDEVYTFSFFEGMKSIPMDVLAIDDKIEDEIVVIIF